MLLKDNYTGGSEHNTATNEHMNTPVGWYDGSEQAYNRTRHYVGGENRWPIYTTISVFLLI